MYRRSTSKTKIDIDYQIYDKTGERVLKSRNKIDKKNTQIKVMQIKGDILEHFDLYAIDTLETADDLTESVDVILQLSTEFRHLHVELRGDLGDDDYITAYPNVEEFSNRVKD